MIHNEAYKIIQTERGHSLVSENKVPETIEQAKQAGCLIVYVKEQDYYLYNNDVSLDMLRPLTSGNIIK